MKTKINELISRSSDWFQKTGHKNDIVISSRLRIARNLSDLCFPHWCTEKKLRSIEETVIDKITNSQKIKNIDVYDLNELDEDESKILMERNLISAEFLKDRGRILIISKDKPFSIILNEEDHIRMQVFSCGIELKRTWELIDEMDDEISELLPIAFHKRYGYLTSCPTNTGTGLRASIMIHLPSLVYTKKISSALKAANQFGLVVRGFHGEGTKALGNMYQISNQMCLGRSEQEIIENLCVVGKSLIEYEEKSREVIMKNSRYEIEDIIFRSLGTLKSCRIISTKESFELLSNIRLGISLGLIKNISYIQINELYFLIQNAHVKYGLEGNNDIERKIRRADIIKKRLSASTL